jgi:hypothetical protein
MRRLFLPLLIVFFGSALALYSQSAPDELTQRNGALASAFLKGCDKLTTAAVDFDGTSRRFQVEWWRCGGKNPDRNTGRFPVHYVVIRPPAKSPAVGLTVTNAGISDEYFIDGLKVVSNAANSRQLLLISSKQYDAPEHTRCILERISGRFECSPELEDSYLVQQELRPREKGFFRKLDEYFSE